MGAPRYRLNSSIMAMRVVDGQNSPVTVPAGSEIEVSEGPLNVNKLVDVFWDGKSLKMFTSDIKQRGERIGVRVSTR